jgi:hypothetical protein
MSEKVEVAPGHKAIYVREDTWKALVWLQVQLKMMGNPMSMDGIIRLLIKEAGYEIEKDVPFRGFVSLRPIKK